MKKELIKRINPLRKILALFIIASALYYHFLGKNIALITFSILMALFLFFDFLHYSSKGRNKFACLFFKLYPKKSFEKKHIFTDGTIFFISTILMILFFPKEIVVLSLIIYGFCDQAERIFGILFSSEKLFWNKSKNWIGTLFGLFIAILAGTLFTRLLNLNFSMHSLIIASALAALAGTLKNKGMIFDDNLLMPWLTALSFLIFQ